LLIQVYSVAYSSHTPAGRANGKCKQFSETEGAITTDEQEFCLNESRKVAGSIGWRAILEIAALSCISDGNNGA
jgi:hypothetical protein